MSQAVGDQRRQVESDAFGESSSLGGSSFPQASPAALDAVCTPRVLEGGASHQHCRGNDVGMVIRSPPLFDAAGRNSGGGSNLLAAPLDLTSPNSGKPGARGAPLCLSKPVRPAGAPNCVPKVSQNGRARAVEPADRVNHHQQDHRDDDDGDHFPDVSARSRVVVLSTRPHVSSAVSRRAAGAVRHMSPASEIVVQGGRGPAAGRRRSGASSDTSSASSHLFGRTLMRRIGRPKHETPANSRRVGRPSTPSAPIARVPRSAVLVDPPRGGGTKPGLLVLDRKQAAPRPEFNQPLETSRYATGPRSRGVLDLGGREVPNPPPAPSSDISDKMHQRREPVGPLAVAEVKYALRSNTVETSEQPSPRDSWDERSPPGGACRARKPIKKLGKSKKATEDSSHTSSARTQRESDVVVIGQAEDAVCTKKKKKKKPSTPTSVAVVGAIDCALTLTTTAAVLEALPEDQPRRENDAALASTPSSPRGSTPPCSVSQKPSVEKRLAATRNQRCSQVGGRDGGGNFDSRRQ